MARRTANQSSAGELKSEFLGMFSRHNGIGPGQIMVLAIVFLTTLQQELACHEESSPATSVCLSPTKTLGFPFAAAGLSVGLSVGVLRQVQRLRELDLYLRGAARDQQLPPGLLRQHHGAARRCAGALPSPSFQGLEL